MPRVTKAMIREQEKQEAIKRLMDDYGVKPGTTIHTQLNHCSRSGMFRTISLKVVKDGDICDISYLAARVLGDKISERHGGIEIGGCGMDMGFALVYNLSQRMFAEGYECIGEGCPSNDHNNGDRDYTPHHHSSGGYALKHRWM